MVTRYLEMAGRDGDHYIEALELLNAAEADTFNAVQTCSGKAKGSECWKELANQPGCHVWDEYLLPEQTVTCPGTRQKDPSWKAICRAFGLLGGQTDP